MVRISEREVELPDAVIGKLLSIAAEHKDIISLSVGEPDFKAPKPLIEHGKNILEKSTHYSPTQGMLELREAIAKKLRKENRIKTDADNIMVSCGSQEALFATLAATMDINESVLLPDPCYLAYLPQIEIMDAVPISFKTSAEENWNINPDEIEKAIDKKKTKAIIINTPANPTGNVLSKKILEEVADIAVKYDLYVFSDEAYEKLIYDKKHVSIGSLNGMEERVLTFNTFSKSFAMCGFRLGYVNGPRNIIEAVTKISHYITLAPPTVSQMMGIKAMELDKKYIEVMRREYDRRRKFIVNGLNEIGLDTKMPNGAFYTFSRIKHLNKDSYKFARELLRDAKVAVVPGREFGRCGEGYIRCSYATDIKLIETALNRIKNFVRKKF